MRPGEYESGTESKEIMEILADDLAVLLPGAKRWRTIKAGDSFEVPTQSKFSLKVKSIPDYCCSYINIPALSKVWNVYHHRKAAPD
jgi:purine/pyrimidine-nucleoside phosphorylase